MNRVASRVGGNDGQKRAASSQNKTKGRWIAGGPPAEVQQCSCAVEAAGAQGLGSIVCRQHAAVQGRLPLQQLETLVSAQEQTQETLLRDDEGIAQHWGFHTPCADPDGSLSKPSDQPTTA